MADEPIGQEALTKIVAHEASCATRAKSVDEKFEGIAKRLFRMETIILGGFLTMMCAFAGAVYTIARLIG